MGVEQFLQQAARPVGWIRTPGHLARAQWKLDLIFARIRPRPGEAAPSALSRHEPPLARLPHQFSRARMRNVDQRRAPVPDGLVQ